MNLIKTSIFSITLLAANFAYASLGYVVSGEQLREDRFCRDAQDQHCKESIDFDIATSAGFTQSIFKFVQEKTIQDPRMRRNKFYIGENGSHNGPGFDTWSMTQKVTAVSACFGIDPFVLAGLIQKESHFNVRVRSHTGAAGLMQLTTPGIEEVSHQLGYRGPSKHGPGVPEVFHEFINCYYSSIGKIWEDMPREYLNSTRLSKKWLNEDPDRNLVYGSVLLKLYITKFKSYNYALRNYNGDDKVKVSYALAIQKFSRQMSHYLSQYIPAIEDKSEEPISLYAWIAPTGDSDLLSSMYLVRYLGKYIDARNEAITEALGVLN